MSCPVRSLAAAAALALVLAPALAAAGDAAMRVELGGGVDTNPLRLPEEGSDREGFVSTVVAGSFAGQAAKLDLRGALSLGARSYPNASDANLLASRLDFGVGRKLSRKLRLDLSLAFRDLSEEGGFRSESGGRAALEATLKAGRSRVGWSAALEGITPRAAVLEKYEWLGPAATVWITTPAGESQLVRLAVDYARRHYDRWPTEARDDDVVTGTIEWLRRRPVVLGVAYSFSADFSNISGADHRRHRLSARAAVTLPGEVTVAMLGSLQRSLYPDQFSTDQLVLLAQMDAAQNALELRVTRPIGKRLELAITAAAYDSELNGSDVPRLPYAREVIGLALSWHAPGSPDVPLPPEPRN